MIYYLKRKNDTITIVELSDNGDIINFDNHLTRKELAPLHNIKSEDWLIKWWNNRSIPLKQDGIKRILENKGYSTPKVYLTRNLGLSLTDYYWLQPIDSNLTWEDVNLFDNDFHDSILLTSLNNDIESESSVPHYTPNGSLQGTLEKSWSIINGIRCLLKGNRGYLSSESLNELIASKLHNMQKFDNHTDYFPIKIHNRPYDYGCYSRLFTSQDKELISAYDIVESEKRVNDISYYEHFIKVSKEHGIDSDKLRSHLEYQIMTDFILSGRDRHLSNIAILRDADSLEFLQMAPIFDSGKCLFVDSNVPVSDRELLSIDAESFASTELHLLDYVTDRSLVDTSKLPSRKFIKQIYMHDSQIDENRVNMICNAYEQKVDLFEKWQRGESLKKIKFAVTNKSEYKKYEPVKTLDELLASDIPEDVKDFLISAENITNDEKDISDTKLKS